MGVRSTELVSLLLVLMSSACYSINLGQLIHDRLEHIHSDKRDHKVTGNPCPTVEAPFPCKDSDVCIPMAYICDNNIDCANGYDEKLELCAAAKRPPVEEIKKFLKAQRRWILPKIFPGRHIDEIAHALAVSLDLGQFLERLHMSGSESKGIRSILRAVMSNNPRLVMIYGMPFPEWEHVRSLFKKLITSGFD